MPAFSSNTDDGASAPFNRETSPVSSWIGAIPEQFRKTPGVVRSNHPTHSVCAWGENAAQFIAQADPCDCFADDGPWAKIGEKGKLLFIGPTIGSNTFLHACEKWFAGYLDETIGIMATDEGILPVRVTNYPGGCRGRWYKLGKEAGYFKELQKMGVFTEKQIGASSITVCDGPALKAAMQLLFEKDPFILLHTSGCTDCARLRAKKGNLGAVNVGLQLIHDPCNSSISPSVHISVDTAVDVVGAILMDSLQVLIRTLHAHHDHFFAPVV